ncbi:MAG: Spo0E family sporulation regulatory protein-aspartic acid phosphatase [Clostridiaceae bacterium]
MVRLEKRIEIEKKRLDGMIKENGSNLLNDLVIEQSKKLDKLIVVYQKIKLKCRRKKADDFELEEQDI